MIVELIKKGKVVAHRTISEHVDIEFGDNRSGYFHKPTMMSDHLNEVQITVSRGTGNRQYYTKPLLEQLMLTFQVTKPESLKILEYVSYLNLDEIQQILGSWDEAEKKLSTLAEHKIEQI